MIDSVKYILSAVIFFLIYILMQWLFMDKIDWKVTIIATIMYGVINTICHIVLNKKIKLK